MSAPGVNRTKILAFTEGVQKEFGVLEEREEALNDEALKKLAKEIMDPNRLQKTELERAPYLFKKFDEFKYFEQKIKETKVGTWKKICYYLGFNRTEAEKSFLQAQKLLDKKYKEALFSRIEGVTTDVLRNLEAYQKHPDEKSWMRRFSTYESMTDALKVVADRVENSKTGVEKFLSLFAVSKTEETLEKTTFKVHTFKREASGKYRQTWRGRASANELDNPETILKLAAFRVIGRNQLPAQWWQEGSSWDGMSFSSSATSIRQDLEGYLKSSKEKLSPENQEAMKRTIGILSNFERMLEKIDQCKLDGRDTGKEDAMLSDIAFEMRSNVERLKPGDVCIIPGGYYNTKSQEGHAVVYEVRRNNDGTFNFSVINTGAEVDKIFKIFDTKNLNLIPSLVTNNYPDRVWKNLTLDQVTDTELGAVLAKQGVGTSTAEMSSVLESINNKFETFGSRADFSEARHQIQVNGTCAYDSIVCWLESDLGTLLYQDLEIYMTEAGLATLQKMKGSSPHVFGYDEIAQVHSTGERVLEQRKQKLAKKSEVMAKERTKSSKTLEKLILQREELAAQLAELSKKDNIVHLWEYQRTVDSESSRLERQYRQAMGIEATAKLKEPGRKAEEKLKKDWKVLKENLKEKEEVDKVIKVEASRKGYFEKIDKKKKAVKEDLEKVEKKIQAESEKLKEAAPLK